MIYASDLDRTLIYSESFLETYPVKNADDKILIDTSKVCSYIHRDVAAHLSFMVKRHKVKFIPVTTRSLAEYKRIRLKDVGIEPDYAITSNGGVILYKGEEIQEWNRIIHRTFSAKDLECICDELDSMPEFNYKAKAIDNSLIFTKCSPELVGTTEMNNLLSRLEKMYPQYNVLAHKNKVYVVPKEVSKDNALTWLKHYINDESIVASGDSAFDLPMLNIADLAIIPGHSDLSVRDVRNSKCIKIAPGMESPLETMKIIGKQLGKLEH